MIWQRSVVAKEKVRTIEVNDYGCKNSFKSSYNSLQISVLKEVPSGNFNPGVNFLLKNISDDDDVEVTIKRGYSEFPERREKIRNKALGRKMPKDTRCKISLNHSKSNLLKINDEVDAYLLTYIYDKITQVFYKHKDNKE